MLTIHRLFQSFREFFAWRPALFALAALPAVLIPTMRAASPFEGEIDFKIMDSGVEWHYIYWIKGDHVRTELRQDGTVYGTYLYDLNQHLAFLIDDKAKRFSPVGPLGESLRGFERNERERERRAPADRSRFVTDTKETAQIAGLPATKIILEGKGPKTDVWNTAALGSFSPATLPNFRAIKDKLPEFFGLYRTGGHFPMRIVQRRGDKVTFSMEVASVKPEPVDDSRVILPKDYVGIGRRIRPSSGGRKPAFDQWENAFDSDELNAE